jgi:hypothetical protein
MQCDSGHRMHMRFGDILDYNRNIIVPSTDCLVVRGSYEPSVLIDERDSVYRAEMLIIFLNDLRGIHVVLSNISSSGRFRKKRWGNANLNDLLVRHTSKENVLLILIRMEPHYIGNLPIRKRLETLA